METPGNLFRRSSGEPGYVSPNLRQEQEQGQGGVSVLQRTLAETWAKASQIAAEDTAAAIAHAQGVGQANIDRELAEIAHAEATGQISMERARAERTKIATSGQAYIDSLIDKGSMIIQNLTEREGMDLQHFVDQTLFELDRNRQIHGEGARMGYSGTRRYGVTPTEEQAMGSPGYSAIGDQYGQQRTEAGRQTDLDVGLAQEQLGADLGFADTNISLADQTRQANVARAEAGMGHASAMQEANVANARAQGLLNQQRTDIEYQERIAGAAGSGGGGGMQKTQGQQGKPEGPSITKDQLRYGEDTINQLPLPGSIRGYPSHPQPGQYGYGVQFAEGGVTYLAAKALALRRRKQVA